jgi:hypothetical protein
MRPVRPFQRQPTSRRSADQAAERVVLDALREFASTLGLRGSAGGVGEAFVEP